MKRFRTIELLTPFVLGSISAFVVLGPALSGGALLNLDLVMFDVARVPPGVWGLGPELPQRVPLFAAVAWLGSIVGGTAASRMLLFAIILAATAGLWRLIPSVPRVPRAGAALLYGMSPFLLTRVATGQLMVAAAAAIAPWVLPALGRPLEDVGATVRRAALFAIAGVVGGIAAIAFVLAGLAFAATRRRGVRVVLLVALVQLPWLVPAAIAATWPIDLAGASSFVTEVDGSGGLLRVLAGHGFWIPSLQVGGGQGALVGLLGLGIFALALSGSSALPAWGRSARAVGLTALVVACAPAVPLLDVVHRGLVALPGGAALREPQRYLFLYLVWATPAAACGIVRLQAHVAPVFRDVWLCLPLVAALVLAGPGLWGIDGTIRPVDVPREWRDMRDAIDRAPGTVLGLPFNEYLDLPLADDRRVLYPLPEFLGGDVIISSDPELGSTAHRERFDPREPRVRDILRDDSRIAEPLATMGVRWVVVLKAARWEDDYARLRSDAGAVVRVDGPELTLFELASWRGDSAGVVQIDSEVAPFGRVEADAAGTWFRPGGRGWLRGGDTVRTDVNGNALVPAGSHTFVWYWPAVLVLIGDLATLGAIATTLRSNARLHS